MVVRFHKLDFAAESSAAYFSIIAAQLLCIHQWCGHRGASDEVEIEEAEPVEKDVKFFLPFDAQVVLHQRATRAVVLVEGG